MRDHSALPALTDPSQTPVPAASATVLAFDFGEARIGVAVGETLVGSARPLITIAEPSNVARFAAIARLVEEWQPARLVVGLPQNDDGSEHAMSARCQRFANQLQGRFANRFGFAGRAGASKVTTAGRAPESRAQRRSARALAR